MRNRKNEIIQFMETIRAENLAGVSGLEKSVSIEEYSHLVREENGKRIWTEALQKALNEHQVIMIPAKNEPYYLDGSVQIPSNRHIEASPDAVIRLTEDTKVLMLRNANTMDGTHAPFSHENCNVNISINGGRWEESNTLRLGYGRSGMYDAERSYYGVSTCMLFNNIENLTLTNMVFVRTAGFAVQLGDAKNVVVENIRFESCFADGIHVNGNVENVLIRNLFGEVGDDLVALNTYDWQNSSVDFGPGNVIVCENIHSSAQGKYKSMRLEPGTYIYDDGSRVDCSLNNVVIRNMSGLLTYKMYYQTPRYFIGDDPEPGDAGSVDQLYFEDIDIDLHSPCDRFAEYLESDPVRGWFGAFELGSNIKYISFENIRLKMYPDIYPLSRMITVGPKSIRSGVGGKEVFDPYISNTVECIELKDITVNGQLVTDAESLVHVTRFDDINKDGRSSGKGDLKTLRML